MDTLFLFDDSPASTITEHDSVDAILEQTNEQFLLTQQDPETDLLSRDAVANLLADALPDSGGGGTLTGSGVAGEIAFWDGSTDLTGDAALLWDSTNKSLSLETSNPAGGEVIAVSANDAIGLAVTTPGTGALGVYALADATGAVAVVGQSSAGWGVVGQTNTGLGVVGEAGEAGGVGVRAEGVSPAATALEVKMAAGATAAAIAGYLNNVLAWSLSAAGVFTGIVRLGWRVGGTLIGNRAHLNLIAGTGITLTPVDQSGTDAVDVTIDASLTGGGATGRVAYWDSETDLTGGPAFTFDDVAQTLTIYGATGGSTDPTVQAVAQSVGATPLKLQTPAGFVGNFLEWFTNTVSQGALPAAGGAYFNVAALSTSATSGFMGLPSCAGTPTGVPSGYPAGVIPMVFDSVGLKLYAYTGGAWKASSVFT